MNLLAAKADEPCKNNVFNVAVGDRTSLNELYSLIRKALSNQGFISTDNPIYQDFRIGDVKHSQADISKAMNLLSYKPSHDISQGIDCAVAWYRDSLKASR